MQHENMDQFLAAMAATAQQFAGAYAALAQLAASHYGAKIEAPAIAVPIPTAPAVQAEPPKVEAKPAPAPEKPKAEPKAKAAPVAEPEPAPAPEKPKAEAKAKPAKPAPEPAGDLTIEDVRVRFIAVQREHGRDLARETLQSFGATKLPDLAADQYAAAIAACDAILEGGV